MITFYQTRPDVETNVGPIIDRFAELIVEALKQVGQACTDDKMNLAVSNARVETAHQPRKTLVEIITEELQEDSWWMTPDITDSAVGLLGEVYLTPLQSSLDILWTKMYGGGFAENILAPGVRSEVPVADFINRVKQMLVRLDSGTVAYLASFLAGGKMTNDEIRQRMFTVGDAEQGTLLDQRAKIVTDTELTWAVNRGRQDLIRALGRNKMWVAGKISCDFGKACMAEGAVETDHLFGGMDTEQVPHPPGCVGCQCFLQMDAGPLPKSFAPVPEGTEQSMVALDVPVEFNELLGVKEPHATLIYLGNITEDTAERVKAVIEKCAESQSPFPIWLSGDIVGLGTAGDGVDAALVGLSSELKMFNDKVATELKKEGVLVGGTWGDYKPHVTLGKIGTVSPDVIKDFGGLWMCEGVRFWFGNNTVYFRFNRPSNVA
jgi:2'-5' RNA ligase